ncbi:hypothetical protein E4U53_003159 [Claviceps sorghi]|nr:hypothetical protein E4U53_003159 [Claviceps sorghi]
MTAHDKDILVRGFMLRFLPRARIQNKTSNLIGLRLLPRALPSRLAQWLAGLLCRTELRHLAPGISCRGSRAGISHLESRVEHGIPAVSDATMTTSNSTADPTTAGKPLCIGAKPKELFKLERIEHIARLLASTPPLQKGAFASARENAPRVHRRNNMANDFGDRCVMV